MGITYNPDLAIGIALAITGSAFVYVNLHFEGNSPCVLLSASGAIISTFGTR
jgi:hypothetical protein